jgi:hypothetical protein
LFLSVAQAKEFLGVRAVLPNDKHTVPGIAGFKKPFNEGTEHQTVKEASQLSYSASLGPGTPS